MSALTSGSCRLTRDPARRVETGAATDDTLATTIVEPMHRDSWQAVIDYKLVEWGRQPWQLAEDELIPPTPAAVGRAIQIAESFRDRNAPPPLRVVPDGDGGVVFERWTQAHTQAIEITKDGRAEFVECVAGRVSKRFEL
jgi:hypothetical protein